MKTFLIALVSICLSVAAQFSLKAGMSGERVRNAFAAPISLRNLVDVLTEGHVLAGFFLYGLGALVWLAVLASWDVSKAYPIVGLGFAITIAIGFLAGEQVTYLRVLGVLLICTGIFLVVRS